MGKSQENNLFLPSGCLTTEAIRLFNDSKLTGENLMKIHRHLEECSLCKEAVEMWKALGWKFEECNCTNGSVSDQFRLLEAHS